MALNKQDHADEAGYDVDLIENVGFVRRNDRHAEDLAEAGGENEKPDERPHERREEPLALMQKAQNLAPDDAAEAGEITHRSEAARALSIFSCRLWSRASVLHRRSCRLRVCGSGHGAEGIARVGSTRCGQEAGQRAGEQHASLVQDDDDDRYLKSRRSDAWPRGRRGLRISRARARWK